MKYIVDQNDIVLKEPDSFIISETVECGQCFNFNKISDESYVITAFNKALHIYKKENDIILKNTNVEEYETIWSNYFDFSRDYKSIKETLSQKDKIIKEALEYAPGIRIINQEFFQCLISFIISQNNRIPMIKKVVNNLSKRYGEYLGNICGEEYFSFPSPNSLYGISAEELMESKTGFRGKYIVDAVNKYVECFFEQDKFPSMTTEQIREKLMCVKGVGPKVADCVMLFSLGRQDAFPTDVWVKRVMSYFYFDKQDTPIKEIHKFAYDTFGEHAGFAQQYLFNYARNFKINPEKEGKK